MAQARLNILDVMNHQIDRRSTKNAPLSAIISVGEKMCARLRETSSGKELVALWLHALEEVQDEGKAIGNNVVVGETRVRAVNDKFN